MKIAVIGTGYVGLVSGVCLAAKGHQVTCLDLRADVVEQLNRGIPHIHERDLEPLLKKSIEQGNFRAAMVSESALTEAEAIMIAVGTPSTDGKIDLSQVGSAAELIGSFLKKTSRYISVIVKSTVLPTTTDTFVRQIIERTSGKKLGDFGLGMNPEFLREGDAIEDFMSPDRIVFGFEDRKTLELMHGIYRPWSCDKLEVNTRTAELIKYTNNSMLALQISAMNEIANIANRVGNIDMMDVVEGVSLDKRWSPLNEKGRTRPHILSYLVPGCGFGGSCFPKDVQALRTFARDQKIPPRMLQSILDVNEEQPHQVSELLKISGGDLRGKKVLVLGLAFKPDTDDVRESASLKIISDLVKAEARVKAHDPIAKENAKKASTAPFEAVDDWENEVASSDIVILATRWSEYHKLTEPKFVQALRGKTVFDARRMFRASDFSESSYLTIGFRQLAAKGSERGE